MNKNRIISLAASTLIILTSMADGTTPVAYFDMEPTGGAIKETVSGQSFQAHGMNGIQAIKGFSATERGARFDGYSTYVNGTINREVISSDARKATVTMWVAPESFVYGGEDIMLFRLWGSEGELVFFLRPTGIFTFKCKAGDRDGEVVSATPIERFKWTQLTGTVDGEEGKVTLYANGKKIGEAECGKGNVKVGSNPQFVIGCWSDPLPGDYSTRVFNGIIDDVTVYNDIVLPAATESISLNMAVPAERFISNAHLRPVYHAMPSANWTNEPHGLMYYGGKYHLFHQRNAQGLVLQRMHWGHLISENLYDWTEAPIAIYPGIEGQDNAGCWSGCVVNNQSFNGGKPQIIYTGVNGSSARIMKADCETGDDLLLNWNKSGIIVDGTPAGYEDFRDPYVFTVSNQWYMVVGTGKDGRGRLVEYKYNGSNWEPNGEFFACPDGEQGELGTFWEMPSVVNVDGKWIVCISSINNGNNNSYYWIGSINEDGKFVKDTPTRKIELSSFGYKGYGLMSPSVLQKDGKTIVIGIVPDKKLWNDDVKMGWCHNMSLPREWSISSDNYLHQKPASQLAGMRSDNKASGSELNVTDGRQFEAVANFKAREGSKFGFELFKTGSKSTKVYYDMSTQKLYVDFSNTDHLVSADEASVSPNGIISSELPKSIEAGSEVKLNIFVDHSIIDIFVNDQWASSVRVFATDKNANGVGLLNEGAEQSGLEAYDLNVQGYISGVDLTQDNIPALGEGGKDPEVGDPEDKERWDAYHRYQMDENGRDLLRENLKGQSIGILLRGNGENLNVHERGAYEYYKSEVSESDEFVYTDNNLASKLNSNSPNVIWIHVEDDNNGDIPFSESTLNALSQYVKSGGNLYLTSFGTKIVNSIGRSDITPNVFNLNGIHESADVWTINIIANNQSNATTEHYMQRNAYVMEGRGNVPNYPIIGPAVHQGGQSMKRYDRNCMWSLNNLEEMQNFENNAKCEVIATWGRDNYEYTNAGIVEFKPTVDENDESGPMYAPAADGFAGYILANGIAGATTFSNPDNHVNEWDFSQKRLLNNALYALANDNITVSVKDVLFDTEISKMRVYVRNGNLAYSNVPTGSIAIITDLQGRILAQVSVSGEGEICLPLNGMMFVKVVSPNQEAENFKIFVR